MVISVDGKGVVMRTQDLREQTRKAAKERKHKMGTRLSKGEKKNAKRMATVAAVYTIAPFVRKPEDLVAESDSARAGPPRPRPEKKRVWASLEKTPEEVIEEAFEEADHRDPEHQKNWVALVDGNKPQIRILRRMAKEKGIDLTIIVDVIHVIVRDVARDERQHQNGLDGRQGPKGVAEASLSESPVNGSNRYPQPPANQHQTDHRDDRHAEKCPARKGMPQQMKKVGNIFAVDVQIEGTVEIFRHDDIPHTKQPDSEQKH